MNIKLVPCPFCKVPIPEDCAYCDICGKKLRYCPSCVLFAKSKICTNCGKPTEETVPDKTISQAMPGHLVGMLDEMRLGLSDKAIIGRRGSYGESFHQYPSVSGLHAKLLWRDEIWQIEDIGSSYGTYLNGEKLGKNEPTPIKVGDILKFADVEFKVTE